ncbi:hypothetical protein CPC16_008679 [Podila verticillata]|nr:hypothetical protein BGZ52_008604 [Haplosporangium bisporale]KAF9214277.1 hypothetical protein BGZ59_003996 [Podila verticillata]KAF9395319.1 hypothetical protein CPC16_008679 [Podila verticillata]KAI9232674.1 MAG: hypothetical protein BYD32DRAFT_427773 [Podila humilis]KFH69750.1 hypothetical protein MVEG_04556 [Podila verticillata NRRL 6337]
MTERLSNTANQYMGSAKETIGSAIGSENLAANGAAQRAQAEAAQRLADTKTHTEGLGHTVEGQAQKKVGSLTGDRSMEARGHANEALGDVQRNV